MKALISGATGFLGGALSRRLKSMGMDVTGLGRSAVAGAELEAEGIRFVSADLADADAISHACRDQEIVYHCGAFASPWGRASDFYASNVTGTQHMISACMEHNIRRLIHVSTPSIYFAGAARVNVKEDAPLPARQINMYAHTKLLAEQAIDRAYREGLPVITIRPRAIFGPGDTSILPRLIDRLQTGRLRIIGDGQNIADLSYVENVVDALLLCAESPALTLGQKYNITNGEPVNLWQMIEKVAVALELPFPDQKIPYSLAYLVAGGMETIYRMLPGQPEPPLTRYAVTVLARSATLDISAARRDLGYQPRFSLEEGFQRFVRWWKETH